MEIPLGRRRLAESHTLSPPCEKHSITGTPSPHGQATVRDGQHSIYLYGAQETWPNGVNRAGQTVSRGMTA